MPKKRKTGRCYSKRRKGLEWWYVDLRDYRDVIEPDDEEGIRLRMALETTDADVADKKASALVTKLEKRRRNRDLGIIPSGKVRTLGSAVTIHLDEKARLEDVTDGWLSESEHMLRRAIDFFGTHRDVASIDTAAVRDWIKHLGTLENGRGGKLSGGTIRHHLNCLSNLFGTAVEKGWVAANPVMNMKRGTKPKAKRREAAWFEPHEAALILEAAFRFKSPKPQVAIPFTGPLVAAFLLTGGRKSEVLGLMAEDVAFDRELIHIRPNETRRLKTGNATRTVPLWPQLREILQKHVFEDGHVSGLLFPSPDRKSVV